MIKLLLMPDNTRDTSTNQTQFWPKYQMSLAPINYFENKYAHAQISLQLNSKNRWTNYQVGGAFYSTITAPLATPSLSTSESDFIRPTFAIPGIVKSVSKSACVLVPDDPFQLQQLHMDVHSLMIGEGGLARIKAMPIVNQNLPTGYVFTQSIKNELLDNIENPYSSQNLDQIFVKTPFDINMLFLSVKICDGVPKCIATPQMNRKKGVTLESLVGKKIQAHAYIQFRLVINHYDKTANLRMDVKMHHIIIVDNPEICDADDDFGFDKADDFDEEFQAAKRLKATDTPSKE